MIHWLFVHAGLDDASGAWYAFWSGICGDLFIVGGVAALFRHINCHVSGCWRPGWHPVHGTQFKVCRRHHPTGGNTVEHVHAAHVAAP